MKRRLPVLSALLLAGTALAQTAGSDPAPADDPSKIPFTDYDPPSTLVVPQSTVTISFAPSPMSWSIAAALGP